MDIKLSGRTKESKAAIQVLVDFLEGFGDVAEVQESVFQVDGREIVLVAFSSQAYFTHKGYYWFSLAKTKYAEMLKWDENHAWMVLICGKHGRYFVPIGQIKSLLSKIPSNRRDGRWDLYIRLDQERAYFGVMRIENHLDVTEQFQRFEQIWEKPGVEEIYVDEAIYIPDSLPEPDRKTGSVVRVIRDTAQSRFVKDLYDFRCQVCGWTVYSPRLKNKWYCEAHHVQPLGKKYRGPDHRSNIIALCPIHHCMMDLGVLAIDPDDLLILSIDEQDVNRGQLLTLKREHGLNQKYLKFHLDNIYVGSYEIGEIELAGESKAL
jgi:hypothetical protein